MTKLLANDRELRVLESVVPSDSLILPDQSLWSHAATFGARNKGGEEFTIDKAVVENFIKVFTSGYPQKIPVDYNHASTTSDPIARTAGYNGQAPKAGDVLELRGVFSAADFTGDLKAAAEKLSAQAGRSLDDSRNLGLWMRWKPTGRALMAIKAGEYTELSIAFDDDLPHNVNGEGQGPGLWAVALLNRPFLDDMLPVAASRDTGRSPAAPASREGSMTKLTVLSVAAAVLGKAITSDDEALTELSALGPKLTELKAATDFRDVVTAEFENEKDPVKVVAKVRELRSQVKTATDAAAEQKKTAIKTTVEATIKSYEKALGSVPLRAMMTRNLTEELEKGIELEKTETLTTLKTLGTASQFTQSSAGDAGGRTGAQASDDEKYTALVEEKLKTDDECKELRKTNAFAARNLAHEKVDQELAVAR
jgi:hypothetical protein